jgi:DegV family protein with EDD domain
MSKIAIVTDSTATIPNDLLQRHNIYVAPLSVMWGKERFRDGVDLNASEFYKRLRKSPTLPTTSGAIQGEFLRIFEDLRGKVDGIVTITVTGALSAAYSSAMNAKAMVPEIQVEIIDSRLATMALGFGALEAAKVASSGGSLDQAAKAARDVLAKVHCFFALDTLEYLRKGGRVSLPAAVLASWLQVKPIMFFQNGKIAPVAKPRTTKKALETLLTLMKERATNTPLHVAVMHADNPEGADTLIKEIQSQFKPVEIITSVLTPVVGTHFGPDALCIAFYNE